jgi:hypothetical protein
VDAEPRSQQRTRDGPGGVRITTAFHYAAHTLFEAGRVQNSMYSEHEGDGNISLVICIVRLEQFCFLKYGEIHR